MLSHNETAVNYGGFTLIRLYNEADFIDALAVAGTITTTSVSIKGPLPFAGYLSDIYALVGVAGTGGNMTVDITQESQFTGVSVTMSGTVATFVMPTPAQGVQPQFQGPFYAASTFVVSGSTVSSYNATWTVIAVVGNGLSLTASSGVLTGLAAATVNVASGATSMVTTGTLLTWATGTVAPTYNTSNLRANPIPVNKGDILKINVTGVNSTTAASDLTIGFNITRLRDGAFPQQLETGTYSSRSDLF